MKNVLIVGAGRLGKGFIGETFDNAGWNITFLDKDPKVEEELKKQGCYHVKVHRVDEIQNRVIKNFKAYTCDEEYSVMDDFFKTYHVPAETFVAHTADGFCSITLNDVDYLEAQNKQVLVCLSNGTTLKIRELFVKCEGVFTPEKGFFKCHRSYIVNLSHIKQFTRTMVTTGISSVPISRNNYSAFKDAYFSYMFDSNSG